jgi:hypothetical protein
LQVSRVATPKRALGSVVSQSTIGHAGKLRVVDNELRFADDVNSEPATIFEIGNTNSRYRFSLGARDFMNAFRASLRDPDWPHFEQASKACASALSHRVKD